MRIFHSAVLGAALALTLAACGENRGDRTLSGAGVGAATGAGIGAIFGGIGAIPGALIGAGVGAGTGALTNSDQVDLGRPVWN